MKRIFLIFIFLATSIFAAQDGKKGFHTYYIGSYDKNVKGDFDKHKGYKCYRKNDFECAFKYFKKSCDAGNLTGCTNLGFLYDQGKGVKQDKKKAISLYEKPCDEKLYSACSNIGTIYRYDKKYKKALFYHKKACLGTFLIDCFPIAIFYENGYGVKKDYKKAMKYYLRTCNRNNDCLNNGIQTGKKYSTKEELQKDYKKACEAGKVVNCYTLGVYYQKKLFKSKDFKDSAKLYKKACDGGFGTACTKYALLYADKQYFPQDDEKAKKYSTKGCDLGCAHGCMLAVSSKNKAEFLEGWKKACEHGSQFACRGYNDIKSKK